MIPAELQNRLFTSYTPAEWAVVLRDKHGRRGTLRWFAYLWRRWTALPGDVFYDPARDRYIIVHSGRPGHVKGKLISGQMMHVLGRETAEYFAPVESVVLP